MMLKSRVLVDLPSVETERTTNPVDWFRGLLGRTVNLKTGQEELTVSAFSLVEALIEGFERAGVNDVISFIVDKKVVYMDTGDTPDDLRLIREAAETKGILERKFDEMHLVLSHQGTAAERGGRGLHTLLDVRILSRVARGQPEMQVDLSSRIGALEVHPGESAKDYGERVSAFAAGGTELERARAELEALTRRLGDALRATLVGAKVSIETATVQLVRPGAQQIAHFRELPFGERIERPGYRSVPLSRHRRGHQYEGPHAQYYYDPYAGFMNFFLLSSLMNAGGWGFAPHHLSVVDPGGQPVTNGGDLERAKDGWAGADAVSFGGDGSVAVDPTVGGAVTDSAGGDSFWGSSDAGASGDSGWSGGGDDGGSGGSSSCGSSCGGGCGGGGD